MTTSTSEALHSQVLRSMAIVPCAVLAARGAEPHIALAVF